MTASVRLGILVLVTVQILAAGCTGRRGGRPRGDAGPGRDAGWSFRDAAADSPLPDGAAPDGGPDAGPPLRGCFESCETAADCVSSSTLHDLDNWSCSAGVCRYGGCNTDAECADAFRDTSYVCREGEGGQRGCFRSCEVPSDCVTTSSLFDEDNWSCTAGTCTHLGCHSDTECADAFSDPQYTCRPADGGLRGCYLSCVDAADCMSEGSLFDADNWVCAASTCRHLGCNGDAECVDAFREPQWVCRAP